jgi:cytochrome c-type biogenesis protein CcmH
MLKTLPPPNLPVRSPAKRYSGRSKHTASHSPSPFTGRGLGGGVNKILPYIALFIIMLFVMAALPVYAQDTTTPPDVTADEVNAIARKMYCPVCENIPLDVCPTEACAQWRDQIQAELEAGSSEDQIIAGFVARYGDRVVGTPQDPMLRTLSLVTPWLIALIVAGLAGAVLLRWWRRRDTLTLNTANNAPVDIADDDYRARLERDLQARR